MSTLFNEKSIGRAIFARIDLMLITSSFKVLLYWTISLVFSSQAFALTLPISLPIASLSVLF